MSWGERVFWAEEPVSARVLRPGFQKACEVGWSTVREEERRDEDGEVARTGSFIPIGCRKEFWVLF